MEMILFGFFFQGEPTWAEFGWEDVVNYLTTEMLGMYCI